VRKENDLSKVVPHNDRKVSPGFSSSCSASPEVPILLSVYLSDLVARFMTILFNPQYLVGHEALFKPIMNKTNLLAQRYANSPNLFIHMLNSLLAGIMRRTSSFRRFCGQLNGPHLVLSIRKSRLRFSTGHKSSKIVVMPMKKPLCPVFEYTAPY
jgi:hypothetical protein